MSRTRQIFFHNGIMKRKCHVSDKSEMRYGEAAAHLARNVCVDEPPAGWGMKKYLASDVTVCLVADIFGTTPERLASAIVRQRRKNP